MSLNKHKLRYAYTYGIADASSAIEAATVITNRQGMSHPKTIPTCPPEYTCHIPINMVLSMAVFPAGAPDTRGNEKVEETEATTPIIENANATVSKS